MNTIFGAFVGGGLIASWNDLPRPIQAAVWWSAFIATIGLAAMSAWQIFHLGL